MFSINLFTKINIVYLFNLMHTFYENKVGLKQASQTSGRKKITSYVGRSSMNEKFLKLNNTAVIFHLCNFSFLRYLKDSLPISKEIKIGILK